MYLLPQTDLPVVASAAARKVPILLNGEPPKSHVGHAWTVPEFDDDEPSPIGDDPVYDRLVRMIKGELVTGQAAGFTIEEQAGLLADEIWLAFEMRPRPGWGVL